MAKSVPAGDLQIEIQISRAYGEPESFADLEESTGNFFGSLPHGPELARLKVFVAPVFELAAICGQQASACYDPEAERLFMTWDPGLPAGSPPREWVIAHEYGHHIAANRANPPWAIPFSGTKRWSSETWVCLKQRVGLLEPSAPVEEAFAESYATLALGNLVSWPYESELAPTPARLEALKDDVLSPWTGPQKKRLRVEIDRLGRGRRSFKLPLDGHFDLSLKAPTGVDLALDVYLAADFDSPIASSDERRRGGEEHLSGDFCGPPRRLIAQVDQLAGAPVEHLRLKLVRP